MIVDTEGRPLSSLPGVSVFAVDPGQTTGWAWACVPFSAVARLGVVDSLVAARRHSSGLLAGDSRFACGQVEVGPWDSGSNEAQGASAIWSMLVVHGEMTDRVSRPSGPNREPRLARHGVMTQITDIVMEDFELRERTMDRTLLSPVRIAAQVNLFAHLDEWRVRWWWQSGSNAKTTVTDDRLKRWGFWQRGQRHANDAIRHLILWMRRNMPTDR